MAQILNLKARGLFLSPNLLSGAPEGAMSVCDNIVIDYDNLAQSRRGYNFYGTELDPSINALFNYDRSLLVSYSNKLAYDSDDAGTWVPYSGTYSDPGSDYKMRSLEANKNFYFTTSEGIKKLDSLTSTPISAGAPRALDGTGTATGATGFLPNNDAVAYRILWGYRDENNNLILGAPSARVIVINVSGTTADVALTFNIPDEITTSWFYQLYRSPTSGSTTVEPSDELQQVDEGNPTAGMITAKVLTVTDSLPSDLRGTSLYTNDSQEGIVNANLPPPYARDMTLFKGHVFYAYTKQKQNYNTTLLGTDIPNGIGYYVDASTGTTLGSPTLATIASTTDLRIGMRVKGTGIPASTYILAIPSGTTVTMTKNATATASVSVEFNDVVRIGDQEYYAATASVAADREFLCTVGGLPAEDIDATTLSLVDIINRNPSNTLYYAYATSGYNELPGKIQFEERGIGGDAFIMTSTASGAWSPRLPADKLISANTLANPTVVTSVAHGLTTGNSIFIRNSNSTPVIDGTRIVTVLSADTFSVPVNVTVAGTFATWLLTSELQTSQNDEAPNRVQISKLQQPEAVTIFAYLDCGSANFPIKRILSLKDSVFVLKDDGIFRITGYDLASFQVTLFDNTVQLIANDSAVTLVNQIYCFTDQGIVAISDNGVAVISRPIENELLRLSSSLFPSFSAATFAVGYESDRKYILFTVSDEADTYATQAFVYNVFTVSWTRWDLTKNAGIVNSRDNKLYFGDPLNDFVYKERKDYTRLDYADESYDVAIVSYTEDEITLSSTTVVSAGMTIKQDSVESVVLSVDSGTVITVADQKVWAVGAAEVFTPIANELKWLPEDATNPGVIKHFQECTIIFKEAGFRRIDMSFTSDLSTSIEYSELLPKSAGGWGRFPWGEISWGSEAAQSQVIRTYVPREKAWAVWLNIGLLLDQSFQSLSLEGISVQFEVISSKIR